MIFQTYRRGLILGSFVFAVAAVFVPPAATAGGKISAGEIETMRQRCEREKTSSPANQSRPQSWCAQLRKLVRNKAYQDRGEMPPLDDDDIAYTTWDGTQYCSFNKNGDVLGCTGAADK
ncbi:MAG: hypothetical protein LBV44_00520 [Methylobacillus sp.]|jgi:hypothetical protein|nr:hypothetical protein [Methylobacillus sp.]